MKTTKKKLDAFLDAFYNAYKIKGVSIKQTKDKKWGVEMPGGIFNSNDALKYARKIIDGTHYCNFLNNLQLEIVPGNNEKLNTDKLAVWVETDQYNKIEDFLKEG